MLRGPAMWFSGLLRGAGGVTRNPVIKMQIRHVEQGEKGAKPPAKAGQIDKLEMPGFVQPGKSNEEGYFTQKAKRQIEELKKKMDKPTVKHTEKTE